MLKTHPYLVKLLVNMDDGFKYSAGSKKKIFIRCYNCDYEKEIEIQSLTNRGFSCPRCSDGISYPEKFMFNVLNQLIGKDFQVQLSKTTLHWCNNYRYDFYINKFNIIIETHGIQHYEELKNYHWQSLGEAQENDKQKEILAINNNITNYIIIDCKKSELDWIKKNIMNSKLPKLLNFKEEDIDWLKCHEFACSSLVKDICKIWNTNNEDIKKIANMFKITGVSVRKYLKQGAKLGWCDYDPIEELKKASMKGSKKVSRKVICLNNNYVYNTITEASIRCKIVLSNIAMCCQGKLKSAGKCPITGKKLKWMYYDEYLKLNL